MATPQHQAVNQGSGNAAKVSDVSEWQQLLSLSIGLEIVAASSLMLVIETLARWPAVCPAPLENFSLHMFSRSAPLNIMLAGC